MPTVIDSLLVEVGIDPRKFGVGRRQISEDFKKLKGDAGDTAKEVEAQGKRAALGFSALRNEIIGLFAAFTAGRGLKEFVDQTTQADAATGHLASNLGSSARELSAWEGAAESVGGTAAGMAATFQGLSAQVQQFAAFGTSDLIPKLRSLALQSGMGQINLADPSGKARAVQDVLADIMAQINKVAQVDPQKANFLASQLGLDQGSLNLAMSNSRSAIAAIIAQQKALGGPDDADTKAAQDRQSAMQALGRASEDLGRKIETALTPYILKLVDGLTALTQWAQQHRPMVEAMFVGLAAAATAFSVALLAPVAELIAMTAAIAAAVAAIAYLYEDWQSWTEGGKSDFGGFWQYFADKWNDIRDVVVPIIDDLKRLFLDYVTTAEDYLKLLYALFFGTGDDIRKAWRALFGDLKVDFGDYVDFIRKLAPAILSAVQAAFTGALHWVENRFRAIWDAITGQHTEDTSDAAGGQGAQAAPADQPAASGATAPTRWGNAATDGMTRQIEGLFSGGTSSPSGTPRGIRNDNPGNLNFANQPGATKEAGPGGRFAVFRTMADGVAALVMQLRRYAARGVDTIEGIVAKWAPSSDGNNENAYIQALVKTTGFLAGQHLNLNNPDVDRALVGGISGMENGRGRLSLADINSGLALTAGARMAPVASSSSTTDNSRETHIASIVVNTQATDAKGIASDISGAIEQRLAYQSNGAF